MLTIFVPAEEEWDEAKEEFVRQPATELHLEHSLVSLSQWESKHHKPFISSTEITPDEILDYISFMILDTNVDPYVLNRLTEDNFTTINRYIEDSQTATKFNEMNVKRGGSGSYVTSEIIYYWMVSLNIPFECQYWHLNRLLTLIRVCNEKNQPPKKMSKKEIYAQNRALNAKRKHALHTKG